eukprot:5794196-Lingulodinium_polyedra.AAC.1
MSGWRLSRRQPQRRTSASPSPRPPGRGGTCWPSRMGDAWTSTTPCWPGPRGAFMCPGRAEGHGQARSPATRLPSEASSRR